MARKEKRLERLFANPSPKDFHWNDLLSVMTASGFKYECNGGSHYMFEHSNGMRLRISKTHPSGILKLYQINYITDALEKLGYKP
ncbi:MAG: type II toxin-antitoxin system HicA family toxin [Burkholderiales bacterium]